MLSRPSCRAGNAPNSATQQLRLLARPRTRSRPTSRTSSMRMHELSGGSSSYIDMFRLTQTPTCLTLSSPDTSAAPPYDRTPTKQPQPYRHPHLRGPGHIRGQERPRVHTVRPDAQAGTRRHDEFLWIPNANRADRLRPGAKTTSARRNGGALCPS